MKLRRCIRLNRAIRRESGAVFAEFLVAAAEPRSSNSQPQPKVNGRSPPARTNLLASGNNAKGAWAAVAVDGPERPLWVELSRPTDVGQTTVLSALADKVFHLLGQTHDARHIEFGEFRP